MERDNLKFLHNPENETIHFIGGKLGMDIGFDLWIKLDNGRGDLFANVENMLKGMKVAHNLTNISLVQKQEGVPVVTMEATYNMFVDKEQEFTSEADRLAYQKNLGEEETIKGLLPDDSSLDSEIFIKKIEWEEGLDFNDVGEYIPNITADNDVVTDGKIVRFDIYTTLAGEESRASIFFDEKTLEYCAGNDFKHYEYEIIEDIYSGLTRYPIGSYETFIDELKDGPYALEAEWTDGETINVDDAKAEIADAIEKDKLEQSSGLKLK